MTPPKIYKTPAGFKVALEDRLKKRASLRGTAVNRVRRGSSWNVSSRASRRPSAPP